MTGNWFRSGGSHGASFNGGPQRGGAPPGGSLNGGLASGCDPIGGSLKGGGPLCGSLIGGSLYAGWSFAWQLLGWEPESPSSFSPSFSSPFGWLHKLLAPERCKAIERAND